MQKLFIFTSFFTLCYSCKNEVDLSDIQSETAIYQKYAITYDQTQHKTQAEASFRTRSATGAYIKLDNKAKVTANQQPFNRYSNSALTIHQYRWEFAGMQDVEFMFQDQNKKLFTTKVKEDQKISIGFPEEVIISKKNGGTFNWVGPEKQNTNDYISLTITSNKLQQDINMMTLFNGSQVKISPEELAKFKVNDEVLLNFRRSTTYKNTPTISPEFGELEITVTNTKKVKITE